MRNKKYRPWKNIVILTFFIILSFICLIWASERWEKIFLIVDAVLFSIIDLLMFFLYIEIQEDRVIVRQGVFSRNRAYESSFKKRVFMFDDIKDIEVEGEKVLRIYLKDGNNVGISIMGCIRKNEIIGLIYEVRAQIKGYEQQYI